jgi:hypothetical protein
LDVEFWTRMGWLYKYDSERRWPHDDDLQTRIMAACLLFGTERAIFKALQVSVNRSWLASACRAVRTLHNLELLGSADSTAGVVQLLLAWRGRRATHLFEGGVSDLQHEYVRALGLLLRGGMLSANRNGDAGGAPNRYVMDAVDLLVDMAMHNRNQGQGPSALTRTCLAALDGIFEGAQQSPHALEDIRQLCEDML